MLCLNQDFNNRITKDQQAFGKNYERPTSEFFVDSIRTEEEMNDIEEILSDQENKKLLVNILQPLTHPVISYVEIFSYIISYVEQGALSIMHITKRGWRNFKKTKSGIFYEKCNLLQFPILF